MTRLRPFIGALVLAALLAARSLPDEAGGLMLSAADSVAHEALAGIGLGEFQDVGAACLRP